MRLEHVIARNVADLREQRGMTQSDLAAAMRANGFTWQTNRAAQVETLRRPVSLLECVGLAKVLGVPLPRLMAGDESVDLPSGASMPLAEVLAVLAGHAPRTPTTVQSWGSVDDLRRVARSLGVPPARVDVLARKAFGVPFVAERERRLGDVSRLSARSAQTKRGHVSRELVAEIRTNL